MSNTYSVNAKQLDKAKKRNTAIVNEINKLMDVVLVAGFSVTYDYVEIRYFDRGVGQVGVSTIYLSDATEVKIFREFHEANGYRINAK